MKVYVHPRCSTCKKALKFLDEHNASYEVVDIIQHPPSKRELAHALKTLGSARKLFNTSGEKYRSLELKDKLDTLSESQALDLLASDGMLVKRPFVVDGQSIRAGFREQEWTTLL